VWWPFVICKHGAPSISFLSKVTSHETVRLSACEVIFHRRLIRRKRYREHALALAKRLSTLSRGDAGKASQLATLFGSKKYFYSTFFRFKFPFVAHIKQH
jgi:hypothetical protein